MMFARGDNLKPLHRPQLVLLTAGEGLDAAATSACVAADADGFDVIAVPWRSLSWLPDGAAALAGLAFKAGAAAQPLTRPLKLAPELIAAIDWLEAQGQSTATRLGNLYPDAVLGCCEEEPAMPRRAPPMTGVLTFAPTVAHLLSGKAGDRDRLCKIGESLCRVPANGDRSALADPARLVLPVKGKVFGFRGAIGEPVDRRLFDSWLRLALKRITPPPPILLPMPDFSAPYLAKGGSHARITGRSLPMHPLAALLPCPFEGPVQVATEQRDDAEFAYLSRELEGPGIVGYRGEAGLLRWLGRTVDLKGRNPITMRLVEPGVGRSVLVDRLRVRGRPELVDFSALGVGVTPFATGGYADVGRKIDGMAGRDRGNHRRHCADRLEKEGCRAGQVVAVITLRDSKIDVPHAQDIQAGIVVRGFRCILRVKQLDPIGPFLHSRQYTPAAHALMLHPFWDSPALRRSTDPLAAWQEQQILAGLEYYARGAALGHLARDALTPPAHPGLGEARIRRLALVRLYAPLMLRLARTRLAIELGRDPEKELFDHRQYTTWFAQCLGRQLAIFRRLHFLHDYHHPGVARTTAASLHSLSENNVSLLGEFPDLETGIFVDKFDQHQADVLFLTRADCDVLKDNYPAFHAVEVSRARDVVKTLAFVALEGNPGGITSAMQEFDVAYDKALGGRS